MVGVDLLIEALAALDEVAGDTAGFEHVTVPLGDDLAGQVLDGQAAIEVLKRLGPEQREWAAGVFRQERERLRDRLAPEVEVPMLPDTTRAALELRERVRRARIVDPELDRALPTFNFFWG